MRRLCSFQISSCRELLGKRGAAQYGVTLLNQDQLSHTYQLPAKDVKEIEDSSPVENHQRLVRAVEAVEQHLVTWRAGMWDSRVPVLLGPQDLRQSRAQLARIKQETMARLLRKNERVEDMKLVSQLTESSEQVLRGASRKWLQDKVTSMRLEGKVEEARVVKEAWLRLERDGAPDAELLERLCCIYGMARMGTFESAFQNIIVPRADAERASRIQSATGNSVGLESVFNGYQPGGDDTTRNDFPVELDSSNSFVSLMGLMMHMFPHFDLLHDLRGYNVVSGYRAALGRLLALTLAEKNGEENVEGKPRGNLGSRKRVLYSGQSSNSDLVFSNTTDESGPDYVHFDGKQKKVNLITLVSQNRYMRSSQLLPKQQMQGIARRYCFVFGVPFEDVKVGNVLLPGDMMDKESFDRLESAIGGSLHSSVKNWTPLFLNDRRENLDFQDMLKQHPQDEWIRL